MTARRPLAFLLPRAGAALVLALTFAWLAFAGLPWLFRALEDPCLAAPPMTVPACPPR